MTTAAAHGVCAGREARLRIRTGIGASVEDDELVVTKLDVKNAMQY